MTEGSSEGFKLPRVRVPELPTDVDWLNTDEAPTWESLRGRFVLLDFWSSGRVSCRHALEDIVQLQRLFPYELVVLGIHGAKFEHEGELESVKRAIQRHGIEHAVASDPSGGVSQDHSVHSWPTQVLVDPEGYAITKHVGEHAFEPFAPLIEALRPVYAERGSLQPVAPSPRPAEASQAELCFPSSVLVHDDLLVIADSGRHRLVLANLDGKVLDVVGSGQPGRGDGRFEEATFRFPQGLAARGDAIFVADTDNHLLRRVDLKSRRVETIAGSGARSGLPQARGPALDMALSSPLHLCWIGDQLFVAHAGTHQVWSLDLASGVLGACAGTAEEGRLDGPFESSRFAQPSGLATAGRSLFVADAESSSVRALDFESETVKSLAGGAVSGSGYVDNVDEAARFQHPTGLGFARGRVLVADNYNHAIREIDPETQEVTTLIGQRAESKRQGDGCGEQGFLNGPFEAARLREPSGLAVWKDRLVFIADSGNHAIRVADLQTEDLATLNLRFPEGD